MRHFTRLKRDRLLARIPALEAEIDALVKDRKRRRHVPTREERIKELRGGLRHMRTEIEDCYR